MALLGKKSPDESTRSGASQTGTVRAEDTPPGLRSDVKQATWLTRAAKRSVSFLEGVRSVSLSALVIAGTVLLSVAIIRDERR
jgi:hypothetical protein